MGLLRLYLALSVLAGHYQFTGAFCSYPGSFTAVCTFYIISGFYISMVLTEKYAIEPHGFALFYVNRLLRLYPTYLIVLIATSVLFAHRLSIWNDILLPFSVVWQNIILDPRPTQMLGVIYTVGIEMIFYAIAPLFVLRSAAVLVIFFLVSIILHFTPAFLGLPSRAWQYEFFPGTLMFFLGGVLSYRLYRAIVAHRSILMARHLYIFCLGAIQVYCLVFSSYIHNEYTNRPSVLFFYVMIGLLIPLLFYSSNSKLDRFIGDLSYPLYVVHFPIISIVRAQSWEPEWGHVAVPALSLVAAAILLLAIERPMDKFRHGLTLSKLVKFLLPLSFQPDPNSASLCARGREKGGWPRA